MPRLRERTHKKLYHFIGDSGQRTQRFSGDTVSESEIRIYDIPGFLIEQPPKKKTRK